MRVLAHGVLSLFAAAALCAGCQSMNKPPYRGPQITRKAPGILERYDAFYVRPIVVYTVEGDYLRRVDDREVEQLGEQFRSTLIKRLGDRAAVVEQPMTGVAVIDVALTDVSTTYAAFQLLPGLVVPNAMRGGASIDAVIKDSVTKETLVTVKDSRGGGAPCGRMM